MEHWDPSTPACQCHHLEAHYMALGLATQMPLGCVLPEQADYRVRLRSPDEVGSLVLGAITGR